MNKQGIGANVLCQVGVVVRDIERAIDAYSHVFGMPRPAIVVSAGPDVAHTRYRGEPTDAQAKLAFFDLGQVTLELIEPLGGPSTWQDHLDTKGEGIHHIAFRIDNTDQVVASLRSEGVDVIQQGAYEGGMYTYLDAESTLGVILELLEDF
jgi:methylmalonyl-CoA epimerase